MLRRTLVLLSCLACALAPRAASALETIPFTLTPSGQIQVAASVDGQAPVPMLVDLDAGVDLLSGDLGSRVAFGADRTYTTWRPSGERMDLPMGKVVSLSLGDYAVPD